MTHSHSLARLVCVGIALGCGSPSPAPAANHDGAGGRPTVVTIPVVAPSSCAGDSSVPAPAPVPDPLCEGARTDVTFHRDVAPLISCTGEVCHGAWRYDTLVSKLSQACCDHRYLVEPGEPSASHLVQAIEGSPESCVGRMGSVSDAGVATVIAWICEGAPDD